ncbi:cell envelope integrity inner membrane protein tola [Plakobranchus ocellatus]|uniref:Cell envelope integrity inner membrane protein tola n=1 Tax=Plakobranchus ocellatus TaxID=259542 RepID=A0AAV4DIU0_9GAST|nr:cell envelope integrity inner membrane protein tola [Plakobranchus ocellatus]
MEFLPLKYRGRVALFPFWTFGVAILVGVAYVVPNWRFLHLACAVFCLPSFACTLVVPESVRWLTVTGRLDDAMEALRKMARLNGKQVPLSARSTLEMIYFKRKEERKDGQSYSYLDLFKSAYLLKCTIVISYMWCTMSLISYGISFGADGLAGNLYLNILLTNCVEIPALLPVLWMMDRIGRRWTTVLMFSIISAATVASLVLSMKGISGNDLVAFCFALVTKMCVDTGWNVIQTWGTELYPTVTRALGYGVAATSARIGGMLAPFVINLKSRLVLTFMTISGMSFVAILLCFILPETRLSALSDNVASTPTSFTSAQDVELEMGASREGMQDHDEKDGDPNEVLLSGHVRETVLNGSAPLHNGSPILKSSCA